MNLNEAIEVLKSYNVVIDIGEVNQAIDTVVAELEKTLPKGYKCHVCGSDKVYLTEAVHCNLCAVTTEI